MPLCFFFLNVVVLFCMISDFQVKMVEIPHYDQYMRLIVTKFLAELAEKRSITPQYLEFFRSLIQKWFLNVSEGYRCFSPQHQREVAFLFSFCFCGSFFFLVRFDFGKVSIC